MTNQHGKDIDPLKDVSEELVLIKDRKMNKNINMHDSSIIVYNNKHKHSVDLAFNAIRNNVSVFSHQYKFKRQNDVVDHKWIFNIVNTCQFKDSKPIISQLDRGAIVQYSEFCAAYFELDKSHIMEVEIVGDMDFINFMDNFLKSFLDSADNMIEWIYNDRGSSISLPVNSKTLIKSAYPWITDKTDSIDSYLNTYMKYDASVLILLGPPGTGKTSLIKHIVSNYGSAKVTYSNTIIQSDYFFAEFMHDSETKFLIMEDADAFLKSRDDGNSIMHKFLNISDGLVSTSNKKIIFSTNLPSIRDIDEALIRPGRCFDILEFRKLTHKEAINVCNELDKDPSNLPNGDVTLAEIFESIGPQINNGSAKRQPLGFY